MHTLQATLIAALGVDLRVPACLGGDKHAADADPNVPDAVVVGEQLERTVDVQRLELGANHQYVVALDLDGFGRHVVL